MNRWGNMNTLRNQIFIGFMLIMVMVLTSVGLYAYDKVAAMLRNNAEKHIQQTAVQASGQLDVLLRGIDTLTAQIATSASVQTMLTRMLDGDEITFPERQLLQQDVRKQEAYGTGIRSLELYTTDYQRVLPLTNVSLINRVRPDWIFKADLARGDIVFLGMDPDFPDVVIAMRHVRLIDRSFAHAGYLMVQIDKSYFGLTDAAANASADINLRESLGLLDEQGRIIVSDFQDEQNIAARIGENSDETLTLNDDEYFVVERLSERTGWKIIILTPVASVMEGITVLRTAIIVSVMVGGVLFLILTFILSTMITRPILNLIKAMRGARFGTLKPIPIQTATMEINELGNTYNQMVISLNELIEVVYQKEIIQSRTELKALQAQINPHFLFNTLEAFYWALDEKGDEELAHIVVAMSGLFRYVISRPDEDEWVTVGDEMDHAERYLKIMEMRMLDRLSWRIDADEASRKVPIPKLLVQPLVENAILHGVEQRVGHGTVIVKVKPSEKPGYTRIEVSDDGPGMSDEKLKTLLEALERGQSESEKGKGVGLANVEKRLHLYYDSDTGLIIRSEAGKGTTMAFEIPDELERRT
ncbi:sensor histidine kinase [Paenibacillus nanensis]|uniref:histidine kinase n=1 Tax=Paenibacillus nanensis TaxID=393251 RepID=A0A3A1UXB7_9BACL|nr:sensor histidine kinase [Paenibacillus nanensis]RIX53179.1 sensor histidine kinase [Paenibacillus nanensis]